MTIAVDDTSKTLARRIAWASISLGARNFGNMLIEWSLRQALDLPQPHVCFDSFEPMDPELIEQINSQCDLLLSPGCTTLQAGQNPAYAQMDRINLPKPCFGGCLWPAGKPGAWAMLVRALMNRRRQPAGGAVDVSIARVMSPPVGSRDPFTHESLRQADIESRFIGCPTLLGPSPVSGWRKPFGNRLVLSLSRFALPAQWRLARQLRRRWQMTLLIHEPYERRLAKWLKPHRVVEYESGQQYMAEYAQADLCITGRLHGALPAIRHGTPVLFYGDPADTRFSLLEYLHIPLRPLHQDLVELADNPGAWGLDGRTFERAGELRGRFVEYARAYGIRSLLST